ncbi:protein kinase [Actinomyces sp. B33]|uniref:serine/threonine-protein kinase n=1 Tax=Actinomyces sp. B33 TaxID=2942131 RepID=UPI0023405D67|nr:serine/threonine-protein kinase [Actinomyces sp. B33]MDC4233969.1 protein kinase [Actinomyces sp. B33]
MTPRTTSGTGRVLGGRYTLLTPIAQGGMGEVWKARDRVTGRIVAAKVLRPELSGEALPLSRLRLEARNSMSVQHPNIANVQDSGEDDGSGWIVMELVDGHPLTDYLAQGARIAPEYLLPVLMQVAMALGAAAAAGVVHRDIKPANVIVRPDGMVKLTDFGISRASDQVSLTADGMVMGTAQYLPPEQAMGETATALGDLYALGVIAYEAAAGRRPFTGETQVDIAFAHVNEEVPPLPADVPGPFAEVILHLLEKDPALRPESGTALVRELVTAAHQLGIPVAPRPVPLPEGGREESPSTREQRAVAPVAPVRHTPRRVLPEELLRTPEGLDEVGAGPREEPARTEAGPVAADAEAPTGAGPAAPPAVEGAAQARDPEATGAPESDASPRARLAARLKERAEARAAEAPAPPSDDAPPAARVPDAPIPVADAGEPRPAAPRAPRPDDPRPRRDERPASGPSRESGGSARAPLADPAPGSTTTTDGAPVPRTPASARRASAPAWRPLDAAPAPRGEDRPPAATAYNRSAVAPPPSTGRRIARIAVVVVLVAVLAVTALFTIRTIVGALTSTAQGASTTEEALTWQSPWPAV